MGDTTFTSTTSSAYAVPANWSNGLPAATSQGHIHGKLVQVAAGTTLDAGLAVSGNGTLEFQGNALYQGFSAISGDGASAGAYTLAVDAGGTLTDLASISSFGVFATVTLAAGSALDISAGGGAFGSLSAINTGMYISGSGTLFIGGTVQVYGTAGSRLTLAGSVFPDAAGAGSIVLGNNGTIEVASYVDASLPITFKTLSYSTAPAGGTLMLDFPGSFTDSIAGFFNPADTIDAGGAAYQTTATPTLGFTETAHIGTLTITSTLTSAGGGTKTQTLKFNDPKGNYLAANPTTGGFVVTKSGTTDYLITTTVACFAEGTRIATTHGEIAVENLRVGDQVISRFGGAAPIAWLGHRTVDCARHPRPHDVWPIRVQAHAFAPNEPARDLLLSPDHAVHVDNRLVPIRYLLNGASIAQQQVPGVTYWHVELPAHDVLSAEGLACESYLDTGNRSAFAGQPVTMAHPDFALRIWEAEACAPLLTDGAPLAAIRARLLARCEALGHATTAEPDLHLEIDGLRIDPIQDGDRLTFSLPPGSHTAVLVSRRQSPADLTPDSQDHRPLGVAIAGIALDGAPVPLDDPRLTEGWHAAEPGWRWTAGTAALMTHGAATLTIRCALPARYWEHAA